MIKVGKLYELSYIHIHIYIPIKVAFKFLSSNPQKRFPTGDGGWIEGGHSAAAGPTLWDPGVTTVDTKHAA